MTRFLIAPARWVAQAWYGLLKAVLPARHKVVLLSRQADTPSRDFLMLVEALQYRDPSLEVVLRCRFIRSSLFARVAYVGEILAQMYHLATARACIVDGYIVPVSLLDHRPEMFVVQTWHALGAIKKFGYQSLDLPGGRSSKLAQSMRMHRNYDLVLCGGPATVRVFAEAFRVREDQVKPLGLPRVDHLLRHASDATAEPVPPYVSELRRRFPLLAERSRRTVLYAPTFRRNRPDHYREVIERFAGEGYTVIVKPHPLVTADVSGANVVNACGVDVLELLPLSDVVITDYSAVAFEAAVLDKPLYFYVFDIDEYLDEHGLNIDLLSELGGAASRDLDEIATLVESGTYDSAPLEWLKEHYVSVARGGCTHRITDVIFDHLAEIGR